MVFERKILRKVFGPTYENGFWRIKTNQKLNKRIKYKNIINYARAQRLGWPGHIEGMQEARVVKAIHSWKPISEANRKTKENDVRMILMSGCFGETGCYVVMSLLLFYLSPQRPQLLFIIVNLLLLQ
jgi:hypothetical protein